MYLFSTSSLAAIILLSAANLVGAHNGTVWIVNQNQNAYDTQDPSSALHQDANQVLISSSAPETLYSKWYATLLHPPGEETRQPVNCTFRNEGSNKFAQAMGGEIVTAAGESIWLLDPLPVTGWNIKCPHTNRVWTSVPSSYGGNVIVLQEDNDSPEQKFNFRTESGIVV